MNTSRTLTTIIALTIFLTVGVTTPPGDTTSVPSPEALAAGTQGGAVESIDASPVTVHAQAERGHRLVSWALERYRFAGLDVPESHVSFHSGRDNCRGHLGLHVIEDGIHRIDVCVPAERDRERAVLHEFAHAWVRDNLSAADRETFLVERNLEVWNDPDVPWEDLGTEHAAEIIRWGLSKQCPVLGRIGLDDHATLSTAFEKLTGARPICRVATGSATTPEPTRIGGPKA
jgi:hypothetical protein